MFILSSTPVLVQRTYSESGILEYNVSYSTNGTTYTTVRPRTGTVFFSHALCTGAPDTVLY